MQTDSASRSDSWLPTLPDLNWPVIASTMICKNIPIRFSLKSPQLCCRREAVRQLAMPALLIHQLATVLRDAGMPSGADFSLTIPGYGCGARPEILQDPGCLSPTWGALCTLVLDWHRPMMPRVKDLELCVF